ncbi:hypothetical protein COLO4_24013 [Corchorus olitorius]|uniref:Uncharacterized protein n=1 Tax=Corchorus olitorius TaxID=93759 RepID=A0A1R3IDK7_9ROSI|nr:hypothetical protein COLO4_24013 [Corchorus olitorius]
MPRHAQRRRSSVCQWKEVDQLARAFPFRIWDWFWRKTPQSSSNNGTRTQDFCFSDLPLRPSTQCGFHVCNSSPYTLSNHQRNLESEL